MREYRILPLDLIGVEKRRSGVLHLKELTGEGRLPRSVCTRYQDRIRHPYHPSLVLSFVRPTLAFSGAAKRTDRCNALLCRNILRDLPTWKYQYRGVTFECASQRLCPLNP